MMHTIQIKNLTIGEGRPKICVPIVGKTREEILSEAAAFSALPADIAEWRADWYEDVFSLYEVLTTAKKLREVLGDTPLLFTFRTAKEGGEKEISLEQYEQLVKAMAESGYVDLIDIEAFLGDTLVSSLIYHAHKNNITVIGSNHDFEKTPPKEEILRRLRKMQILGADIPKIALMPTCKKDVLTLLEATLEMYEVYADRPIITMSMAKTGVISRLSGETFGSAITFGAASKASAPGQIGACDLESILNILHSSL